VADPGYYNYTYYWPFTTTTSTGGSSWVWKVEGTATALTITADAWLWNGTGTNTTTTIANPYEWVWRDDRTEEQKAADAEAARQQAEQLRLAQAERQAAWEAGRPERERLAREKEKQARAAKVRARRLLMSVLTVEQQDEFRRLERFHVIGADGKKYRVHRGWHHNVELVEQQDEVEYLTEQFCIAPRNVEVPEDDNLAAQKLMIEGDLASFRRIANITRIHRVADAGGQDVVRREALG